MSTSPLLFNPSKASIDELEKTFVGRHELLDQLQQDLVSDAEARIDRHWQLIGPRGSGKTHFTELLARRLLRDHAWRVVRFPEEHFRIATLAEFLEHIALEVEGLASSPWEGRDSKAVEDLAIDRIRANRERNPKPILVVLENLGLFFERKVTARRDQARLREVLSRNSPFVLVCTSTGYVDAVLKENAPFYDFFHTFTIDDLTRDQVAELVDARAKWDSDAVLLANPDLVRARLDAIFHFSGGNPRLVLSLYSILRRGITEELHSQLLRLLDDVTPYYQARLKDVSPQMERILSEMALADRALTPSEIAKRLRMPTNYVTANVARLDSERYVRAAGRPDRRRRYYEVRDRLFRIWIQMREDSGARTHLRAISTFFQHWYEGRDDEIWDAARRLAGEFWENLSGQHQACRDRLLTLAYLDDASSGNLMIRALQGAQPKLSPAEMESHITGLRKRYEVATDLHERLVLLYFIVDGLCRTNDHRQVVALVEPVLNLVLGSAYDDWADQIAARYLRSSIVVAGLTGAFERGRAMLEEQPHLTDVREVLAGVAVGIEKFDEAVRLAEEFSRIRGCDFCTEQLAKALATRMAPHAPERARAVLSLVKWRDDDIDQRVFELVLEGEAAGHPRRWLRAARLWPSVSDMPTDFLHRMSCVLGHSWEHGFEGFEFQRELERRRPGRSDNVSHLVMALVSATYVRSAASREIAEWIAMSISPPALESALGRLLPVLARRGRARRGAILDACSALRDVGADLAAPYATALEVVEAADPDKAKMALHPEVREAVEILLEDVKTPPNASDPNSDG